MNYVHVLMWCVLSVFAGCSGAMASDEQVDVANVLLINSYNPKHEWRDRLIGDIAEKLESSSVGSNRKVRIYYEFLDADNYSGSELDSVISDVFRIKYESKKIDLILTADDRALSFVLQHKNDLFADIPIVFFGLITLPDEVLKDREAIAGIQERTTVRNILQAIRITQPDTKNIAVVAGELPSTKAALSQAYSEIEAVKKEWNIIELYGLTLSELKSKLRNLPSHTVIINFSYYKSVDGYVFSEAEGVRFLRSYSSAPIYSPWSDSLGMGVLAGLSDLTGYHAEKTVSLALRVLAGEEPVDLPILTNPEPNIVFDYNVLAHYGLAKAPLPVSASIVNQPLSFYEKYYPVLIPASLVVLALCSVIVALVHSLRTKKRKAAMLAQEKNILLRERTLERRSMLARRMEALGRLAGGITHDVNNILGGIAACACLAQQDIPETNPAHEDVSRILAATERGKELMKQVLASDKADSFTIPELVDVRCLLGECLDLLRPQLSTEIQLRVRVLDEIHVWCVPSDIHQVLLNVCLNGAQAMPEGGELTLNVSVRKFDAEKVCFDVNKCSRVSEYGCIEISDTGCGISPEIIESIFDPFFTTKHSEGGTGLGLSQVHSLLKRNNGMVEFSTGSSGTSFHIYLPQSLSKKELAG